MKYCVECGTKLIMKQCEGEGMVPYCSKCKKFRFPQYNVAISIIILNPNKDKILLIKQYGKDHNILVAGYVNKGENPEHAVVREAMEEMGFKLSNICYLKSEYFKPSETLMINYLAVSDRENFDHMTSEVDSACWFIFEDAKKYIYKDSLAEKFLLNYLDNQKK